MSGRIVIRRDDGGKYRFNLLDDDGTVLTSSKGFGDLDETKAGLERARRLTADAEVVDQTNGGGPVRASAEVTRPDNG